MKFCRNCSNMLYLNIDYDSTTTEAGEEKLAFKCRFRGNVEDLAEDEGVCVVNTELKRGEQKFNLIVNSYTKEDPTIPHIYSLRCPNTGCKTNVDQVEHPDVLYIRYDDAGLKYLYMCVECNTVWKTNDK